MTAHATPADVRSAVGAEDQVTPYHWLVVIIASCGWLFDCMDQRLFILARESALKELLGRPARPRSVKHVQRLRHDRR